MGDKEGGVNRCEIVMCHVDKSFITVNVDINDRYVTIAYILVTYIIGLMTYILSIIITCIVFISIIQFIIKVDSIHVGLK